MSKIASFAASVTLTSSDGSDAEGNQVDFGPFVSNVSGLWGASTSSPATMSTVVTTANNITTLSSGPMAAPNVAPMYLGIIPMTETTGTLALMARNSDAGVQISSDNPSFIPVFANNLNADHNPTAFGTAHVFMFASNATPVKVAWI